MVVMDSPLADSATARDAASRFLSQNCPWADVDAVLLVISELVANAARHTAGWWHLRLSAEPGVLTVEMDDDSPEHPVAREPDFTGGGGFGWHMVLRLAGRVEISPRPSGKTVRAIWSHPAAGPAAV